MREILFRGYSEPIGRWYYGMLEKKDNGYIIIDGIGAKPFVEEDSVGQYTGFQDKNCKKIFEGDILQWDIENYGYAEMVNGKWMIVPETLTLEDFYINEFADKVKIIGNVYEEQQRRISSRNIREK